MMPEGPPSSHDRFDTLRSALLSVVSEGQGKEFVLGTLMSVVLPMLFFWRLWTPNLVDRLSIVTGDFTHQYYPLRAFAARELAAGRWPLWNPHIYGGQPGLADPQMAVLYPPNLITALLFGGRFSLYMLEWQVIFHFMLASLFMLLFIRRRTGSFLAGIVAAPAFTFGGYLTSFPVQQVTILETAIWLPLILFFLDWGLDGTSRRRLVQGNLLAGLALGMAILAGHPQTALYVFYVAAGFAFLRGFRGDNKDRRALFMLPIVPLVALGTSAAQLLPTLEFIALSSRQAANYTFSSTGLGWHELSTLLLPNFFGGSPLYVGLVALVLVGWGILSTRGGREKWWWGGLALLSLLLSLGDSSFLYSLFYFGVPGFSHVRDQERALFLFSFAIAVLAGAGAAGLLRHMSGRERRRLRLFHRWWGRVWLVGLLPAGLLYIFRARALAGGPGDAGVLEAFLDRYVFLLVVTFLAWGIFWGLRRRINARLLVTLLAALLLFDLFSVNWHYNLGKKSPPNVFPPSPVTAWLQSHTGDGRIASAGKLPAGNNAGLIYAWEDTTGNDPLRLEQTVQFARHVETWRRWQLLHVRYVLSRKPLHDAGLDFRFNDDRVAVYAMTDPFPRAWLAHDVIVPKDDSGVWDMVNDPKIDLRRTAVMEPGEGAPPVEGGRENAKDSVIERLSEGGRRVFDVEAGDHGMLVISQVYYPGWTARLDDRPAHVYRVDGLLQGVAVPAGTHRVETVFRPTSFLTGLLITLLTLVVCLILVFLKM